MSKEPTIFTNPHYWDCECPHNYIHAKAERLVCPVCGANEMWQPDSRRKEVVEAGERKDMFFNDREDATRR